VGLPGRGQTVAERAGQQNQIPEAKSQAGAGRTTTPWVGWPQGRRAGAPGEARHRINDPAFMATGTHMPTNSIDAPGQAAPPEAA